MERAGSGTTGAVASVLGRDAVLVDDNPEAVRVMTERMPHAVVTHLGVERERREYAIRPVRVRV